MRLLLVEDDTMIGEVVLDLLRAEHYAVDWVKDGDMADTALQTQTYDLVLLDLGLPRKDGLDVLRSMRLRKLDTPVLVATARDAVEQRIAGLDAGADDYVLKPYDLDELLARIRALLRRASCGQGKDDRRHALRQRRAGGTRTSAFFHSGSPAASPARRITARSIAARSIVSPLLASARSTDASKRSPPRARAGRSCS